MAVRSAVPAVYLILIRDDSQILLMRRCNTGYQDGNYSLPSGHVEDDELPRLAMVREAQEEIGITILPCDLILVHIGYRPRHDETGNRVDFYFRTKYWKGEIHNAEPHKCDDLRWVPLSHLPENMTPHVRHTISCVRKRLVYSELDLEWLKAHGEYALDC